MNVSHIFAAETWGYTGSVATHGPGVGAASYRNALADADALLSDVAPDDARAFLREYVSEWGDLADSEARAVLLQFIVSDARECGLEDDPQGFDWDGYRAECERGTYCGRFWRDDSGAIHFDMEF